MGAPGGVSGGGNQEPVGGQHLAWHRAGHGWAVEWELLLLQWPRALPGDLYMGHVSQV